MRLEEPEVISIIGAIESFLMGTACELRLHGSRVDDNAKGGDIDLLLVVDSVQDKDALNLQKHKILVEIKEVIGEQKIDLMIVSQDDIKQDPFVRHVFSNSIQIKKWL